MKNLLTKILFIVLLSLAIVPSGVQANLFTMGGKEFAKEAAAAAIIGVVMGKGDVARGGGVAIIGGGIGMMIAGTQEGMEGVGQVRMAIASGVGTIAAIWGSGIKIMLAEGKIKEVLSKILLSSAGAGTGAVVGTIAGESISDLGRRTFLAFNEELTEIPAKVIWSMGIVWGLGSALGIHKGTATVAKMLNEYR